MKTLDYVRCNVEIADIPELCRFSLKYESMHEAWNATNNINHLITISKIEKLLTKENLAQFAIALSERESYRISNDEVHGEVIQSAKNWMREKSATNRKQLGNAIEKANEVCADLSKQVGEYSRLVHDEINKAAADKNVKAPDLRKLNNLHEYTWPTRIRIKIISSGRAAAYASYYEDLNDVIGATMLVVKDLCDINISIEYYSEICRMFRNIFQCPFDKFYEPLNFKEWTKRKIFDRFSRISRRSKLD